jgi:hypothetical protein
MHIKTFSNIKYIYIYIYIYMYTHTHTHQHTHTRTRAHTQTQRHTHTHAHTYAHTQTHRHTHTHTQAHAPSHLITIHYFSCSDRIASSLQRKNGLLPPSLPIIFFLKCKNIHISGDSGYDHISGTSGEFITYLPDAAIEVLTIDFFLQYYFPWDGVLYLLYLFYVCILTAWQVWARSSRSDDLCLPSSWS